MLGADSVVSLFVCLLCVCNISKTKEHIFLKFLTWVGPNQIKKGFKFGKIGIISR